MSQFRIVRLPINDEDWTPVVPISCSRLSAKNVNIADVFLRTDPNDPATEDRITQGMAQIILTSGIFQAVPLFYAKLSSGSGTLVLQMVR